MNTQAASQIIERTEKWQTQFAWDQVYKAAESFRHERALANQAAETVQRMVDKGKQGEMLELFKHNAERHEELSEFHHQQVIDAHQELLDLENLVRAHAPTLLPLVAQVSFFDPCDADLSERLRDLRKLEGEVRALHQPTQRDETKGVSLLDATMILSHGEEDVARATVKKWQNSRSPKLPPAIGKCPTHPQRNLYEVGALLKFIAAIEGQPIADTCRAGLVAKLRTPRPETPSKPPAPTAKSKRTKSRTVRKS